MLIKEEKSNTFFVCLFRVLFHGLPYTYEINTCNMLIIKIDLQMREFWVIHNYTQDIA